MRRPDISRQGKWSISLVASVMLLGVVIGLSLSQLYSYEYRNHTLGKHLSNVTVLADQRGAALTNAGQPSLGPPAASVASGKATPPPTALVPTEPTATPATVDEQRIVAMVLARIPRPKDGHTPTGAVLQKAIVATLVAHPNLTNPQVSAAVTHYLRTNPPPAGAPGKSGPSGTVGSPGMNGPSGDTGSPGTNGQDGAQGAAGTSVTGAHICGDSDTSSYCTQAASGDLVEQLTAFDGTVSYVDTGRALGDTGPQGPGPTDQQVADAVDAWMAQHPQPVCPSDYTATDITVDTAGGGTAMIRTCVADGSSSTPTATDSGIVTPST